MIQASHHPRRIPPAKGDPTIFCQLMNRCREGVIEVGSRGSVGPNSRPAQRNPNFLAEPIRRSLQWHVDQKRPQSGLA